MKIVIFGGNSHLGRVAARHWREQGVQTVSVQRSPATRASDFNTVALWDGRTLGPWLHELAGADAVLNLAGRTVNCRYHAANRREIVDSRVDTTRLIGEALRCVPRPGRTWLQMSTATLYAHRYDAPNTETSGKIGGDEPDVPETWRFSIEVARAWEAAATATCPAQERLVLLRTVMVMSPDAGGVFVRLKRLARCGLGGPLGNGRQFVSWIHEVDFCRALDHLIASPSLGGPVNLAAPEPLPNRDFLGELVRQLRAPVALPSPEWLLELGTWLLRTETELVLKSRRVVSEVLPTSGFHFRYPNWSDACADLLRRG